MDYLVEVAYPTDSRFEWVNIDYLRLLEKLNTVLAHGHPNEKIEGNYFCGSVVCSQLPSISLSKIGINKTHNLLLVCNNKKRVLEVGFNVGHSALAILCANPDIEYYGVDIMRLKATFTGGIFLKKHFGDRFHLYQGDSRVVLPRLCVTHPDVRFDAVHIDGGHELPVFLADFFNCHRLSNNGALMLVDDTTTPQFTSIHACLNDLIEKKFVTEYLMQGWQMIPQFGHHVYQVNK